MQNTIKNHLWTIGPKGVDILSRGSIQVVFGDEVCYIGPTPEGEAVFWVGPGDIRRLGAIELKQAGFLLKETLPNKGEF